MLPIPSLSKLHAALPAIGIFLLLLVAPAGTAGAESANDAACRGCHTTQGLSARLPSGEILPLTVDLKVLQGSVHKTLQCMQCHTGIQRYPHPQIAAPDYRGFQLETSRQCEPCHAEQARQEHDGIHARQLAAGNPNAATCTDCHGSHAVDKPGQPRHRISTGCGKCHAAIYEQYIASAHGRSLLENSNPDVPICTDCHSAHKPEDPRSQAFRLKSPKLCAKCHSDAKLMRKYNLTADVFNTYVADFHGMTVTLFEKQHPDQRVNTAVCTDCHGIHDIQKATDANSTVIKENLLSTCRRCHPDATAAFPDSWVGHFPPSRDRYPLVYYVNLFYMLIIPITIGGMILFVFADAGGRILRRFRKNRP